MNHNKKNLPEIENYAKLNKGSITRVDYITNDAKQPVVVFHNSKMEVAFVCTEEEQQAAKQKMDVWRANLKAKMTGMWASENHSVNKAAPTPANPVRRI